MIEFVQNDHNNLKNNKDSTDIDYRKKFFSSGKAAQIHRGAWTDELNEHKTLGNLGLNFIIVSL
jgi:hypothetical protein